jgi:hypothetical protein
MDATAIRRSAMVLRGISGGAQQDETGEAVLILFGGAWHRRRRLGIDGVERIDLGQRDVGHAKRSRTARIARFGVACDAHNLPWAFDIVDVDG